MSYKPDEGTLMAYLYGELEGKEKETLQLYLQGNPEELKKVQDMANVLKMMSAIGDKEVIAPPVFAGNETALVPYWKSTSFKTVVSIAASFLFLLVASKLLGPEINFGNGELRISFGNHTKRDNVSEKGILSAAPLTAEDVQKMINSSIVGTSQALDARMSENQQKLDASIHKSLDQNSKKVDDLIKNTSQASQDQLRSYVSGLQTENLRLMKDYFQLSAKEQNDYVEKLMVGFSKYVQEQRAQDMLLVQHKVEDIEKNSDQFKMETEQLLASIISNKPVKKSY
jgi:hypothetical protein